MVDFSEKEMQTWLDDFMGTQKAQNPTKKTTAPKSTKPTEKTTAPKPKNTKKITGMVLSDLKYSLFDDNIKF